MTECQRLTKSGFISESYLKEEVRNEYLISVEMKKVWVIELDLLDHFIKMCEKYNLTYWVGFGTLLGAVRHRGFIPWDDDLDVWMPRNDYEKLLTLKNEFKEPYFLQTTLDDIDYYSAFARLRNSNTTGILVSKDNKCNNGIYMDIYPLDGLCNNMQVQKIRSCHIRVINTCAHAYLYNVNPSIITRSIHCFLRLPFIPYDYKKSYMRANAIAKKISWEDANKVGIVVFWAYPFDKSNFDKESFKNSLNMQFEHLSVSVPAGYDEILRTLYGDYMKYPPADERGKWHNFEFDPDTPYTELEERLRNA